MTATIEISLYPLLNDYPASVLDFLQKLKNLTGIEIQSNGMSTIIIGNFDVLWPQLGHLIHTQLTMEESVFILKIAPGRREYSD
ncbi:MAG: hypothetical protein ABJC12_01660 [Saprospiraceae bacterium]